MVTGGNLNAAKGGQAVVNIYEAENAALTQWKYRGVLFMLPEAAARTAECPNFFKLGDQWVLFVSPYGKVQYFVGDFNAETCRFEARTRGLVDGGPNFYAPNTMQVPDGRRLVWGWVNGFPGGHGWNGCLSLPRELSLSRAGQLRQVPAPQLSKLRGKRIEWRNLRLEDSGESLILPGTNTFEIRADIDLQTAESIVLEFKRGAHDARPLEMKYSGTELKVLDVAASLPLTGSERKLSLRIFMDRSVLEVFANDTVCITKRISPLNPDARLAIRAQGGTAQAKLVQAWPMKTIW
jgi:beta-fructofuranosidase